MHLKISSACIFGRRCFYLKRAMPIFNGLLCGSLCWSTIRLERVRFQFAKFRDDSRTQSVFIRSTMVNTACPHQIPTSDVFNLGHSGRTAAVDICQTNKFGVLNRIHIKFTRNPHPILINKIYSSIWITRAFQRC